jgi:hypothetical protein
MQPEFNNHVFEKGIKDSIDISKLRNNTWAFPTLNVRLFNKDGNGYIVTPTKGNTVNNGVGAIGGVDAVGAVMKIKTDYIIIAAKEFNGIIYIISQKADATTGLPNGEGQIGVYPAPNVLITNGTTGVTPSFTGFPTPTDTYPYGRFYAPLGNFNPTTLPPAYDQTATYSVTDIVTYNNHIWTCTTDILIGEPFDITKWTLSSTLDTSAFGFTFNNMTEIEIRPHYDNSVNLYIVDYTNPNRVVNSGFDMTTGALTNTIYTLNSFASTLNQFMGVSKNLSVHDVDILAGGTWKYGNYFFYLRYATASLDKTDVVYVTNACQVYDGNVATASGVQGGDGVTGTSDKKIELYLKDIDPSYTYINVCYTRYYGDASGVQLWESFEIGYLYLIKDITTATIGDSIYGKITLVGDEDVINISDSEIVTIRGIENICKTQAQLGNRWWGANWKSTPLFNQSLKTFAEKIRITYDDTYTVSGAPLHRTESVHPVDNAHGQYDNYGLTYDYVGYFRGEPYVFGVVFELNTGQITEAFPMNGVDNYLLGYLPTHADYDKYYDPDFPLFGVDIRANLEGRYRFPTSENSGQYRGIADGDVANDTLHILGVKFDMTFAKTYLGTEPAEWIKANVRGMYFVRMDRKPLLKYQGITLPGSKSYLCYDGANPLAGGTPLDYTTGSDPDRNISYNEPNNAGSRMWLGGGQTGKHSFDEDPNTWLDVCTDNINSYGQFVGKLVSGGYVANYWGYAHEGGNQEALGGDSAAVYKDYLFPIYRGYMPMMYYKFAGLGDEKFRYYMSRWFHVYGKQCFFAPDYFLEPTNPVLKTKYWIKHVARTQDFVQGHDYWYHTTQSDYDHSISTGTGFTNDARDLIPQLVMAEVATRYMYDSLLDAEYCNVYEIGNVSDIVPTTAINGYVNAGCDFTGTSDYSGDNDVLWRAHKENAGVTQRWSNRSVRSQKYIGIDTAKDLRYPNDDPSKKNYRLAIVNMYEYDPTPTNIGGAFNLLLWETGLYNKPLYRISDFIAFYDDNLTLLLEDSYTCYKGDCFLQRFYFKQLFFNCSDFTARGSEGQSTGRDPILCRSIDGDWPQIDNPDIPDDDNPTVEQKKRYAYGMLMGIVVEMKYNGNMRHRGSLDTSPTYYPITNAWDWNIYAAEKTGIESDLYNTGYHRTLDLRPVFMYNSSLPTPSNIHLTRIRHSDEHSQYSIVDGYKTIMPLNYKDYDSSKQQIMKIVEFNGKLISVQEDCINEHYALESTLSADITSGQISLGQGSILSDKVRRIAEFGTQHQYSVIKTENAIYGVDSFRRTIWRANMATTDSGSYVMGGTELNKSKYIDKWIYDWFEETQPITDIISRLPDTPLLGKGITTGYDAKYKDVLFSFFSYNAGGKKYTISGITKYNMRWIKNMSYSKWVIVYNEYDYQWYYCLVSSGTSNKRPDLYPSVWKLIDFSTITDFNNSTNYQLGDIVRCCPLEGRDCIEGNIVICTIAGIPPPQTNCSTYWGIYKIPINCCETANKALVFNEDIDEFVGEVDYPTVIMVNNYRDMFTTGSGNLLLNGYLWKHDQDDFLWFYGQDCKMQISWYENANNETSSESSYTKHFESQDIHGDDKELYKIEWQTEYQDGEIYPYISNSEFWRNPEYLEHHWKVPIMVKTDANNMDFNTESSMQGTYLKTTLTYKQRVNTFIKNISTWYRKSSV